MGVVNPQNLCVPKWVSTRANLRRPEHNVGVSGGVDHVAITPDVICGIVRRELLNRKHRVVDQSDRVPFFICEETRVITVKTLAKKPAEEMDAKLVDKILEHR